MHHVQRSVRTPGHRRTRSRSRTRHRRTYSKKPMSVLVHTDLSSARRSFHPKTTRARDDELSGSTVNKGTHGSHVWNTHEGRNILGRTPQHIGCIKVEPASKHDWDRDFKTGLRASANTSMRHWARMLGDLIWQSSSPPLLCDRICPPAPTDICGSSGVRHNCPVRPLMPPGKAFGNRSFKVENTAWWLPRWRAIALQSTSR